MSCAVEKAKGWAIGMIAASIAVTVFALGIGGAIAISHVHAPPPTRTCVKGHSEYHDGSTPFICDEWVPIPQASP